jgi:hypothetical protein
MRRPLVQMSSFVSMPVASMCKPVVVVTFAPFYTLFIPSACGVLLAVVDVTGFFRKVLVHPQIT